MTEEKVVLHHLNNSQSQRILWFLEELHCPYELKLYERNRQQRSPEELKQVHPLGKSPVIQYKGQTIAESSIIIDWLATYFDKDNKFHYELKPEHEQIYWTERYLAAYGPGNLSGVGMVELLMTALEKTSPWYASFLVSPVVNGVRKMFSNGELKNHFSYLEQTLEGKEWFVGDRPGIVEFNLIFSFDTLYTMGRFDKTKYPNLGAWMDRCHERPAWKESIKKGNGYNLKFF